MDKPRSQSRRTSVVAETGRPNTGRWVWPINLMLLLISADAGCSGPQRPAEDVDWGQPKSSVPRRTLPRENRSEPAGGEATAASAGGQESVVVPEPGGGGDSSVVGNGKENGPGASDLSNTGAGEVPGAGEDGPGGASDTPPPALPGREPVKPELSANEAAQSAKQLLQRAQQLLRTADTSAAAEAAIKAYDQVLPHAESDAECKKLCGQLEGVLNAAGRGRGRADAVPTRFE